MKTSIMRFILYLIFFPVFAIQAQQWPKGYKKVISGIMQQQVLDWSRGDPDAFMQAYWKSDSLVFISSSGITYGWQNMLDRYNKSYPDAESMGQLLFSDLHFKRMNPRTVWVRGNWQLIRSEGDLNGYFTLIWMKRHGRWVIVADHTS